MRPSVDLVRSPVGDVELGRIAAGVKAMRADSRRDELDLAEALAVDDEHAVGHHVGDVEELAVGRDANVLRHALPYRADDLVASVRTLHGLGRQARLDEL